MGVHLHRRSFVSQCDELGGLKHGVTRHDRQPQQAAAAAAAAVAVAAKTTEQQLRPLGASDAKCKRHGRRGEK